MSGLLMISLGLLISVVWALSAGVVLSSSNFETNIARYCQAILLAPVISGLVWLIIVSSGNLYSAMLLWLNIEPVSTLVSSMLMILALLICLPLFLGGIFMYHFSLLKLDVYLGRL